MVCARHLKTFELIYVKSVWFLIAAQINFQPICFKLPSPGYTGYPSLIFVSSFLLVPFWFLHAHPFSQVLREQSLICSSPLPSSTMQARLQLHLQGASLYEGKTLHSFRHYTLFARRSVSCHYGACCLAQYLCSLILHELSNGLRPEAG